MPLTPTRRQVLKVGAAATAGMAAGALPPSLVDVLAQPEVCGNIKDIEHVVFLIQENRSFDHYFGAYPGVRGFGEYSPGSAIWNQQFNPAAAPTLPLPLRPFHLDSAGGASCVHDIGHQWVIQHEVWHSGAMDAWVSSHIAAAADGPSVGPLTMGYYDSRDLPFYYALADAFTICDSYHASSISGTVANRLYTMSGTLDPSGADGGPGINTPEGGNQQDYLNLYYKFTWKTMPEQLEAAKISWKVYNPAGEAAVPALNDNYLFFFKNFGPQTTDPNLLLKAFVPTFPAEFVLDCQQGTLPSVSWVITPFLQSEHPPTPPGLGQDAVHQAIAAVAGNADLWKKTAIFVFWDENGGFFDHVIPPTPPAGTPGESLTSLPATAGGIAGPIGLGFRVPMLVVSPFSRNPSPYARNDPLWQPQVCSDLFDHTSTLRFLEERFGVVAPNLTAWRRQTVGDLTSAFNFAAGAQPPASLPATAALAIASLARTECVLAVGTEVPGAPLDVAVVPRPQVTPRQEQRLAVRPSGPVPGQGICGVSTSNPANPAITGGGGTPNTSRGTSVVGASLDVAAGAAILAGAWWNRRLGANRPPAAESLDPAPWDPDAIR